MAEPTYIFKDGQVYTMTDGQVVGSVKESEFEPAQGEGGPELPMPEAPAGLMEEGQGEQTCPNCLNEADPHARFCDQCGANLEDGSGAPEGPDEGWPPAGGQQAVAQTVTTPNGLKGRVLARTPHVWGDELTVRFDNGTITRLPVDQRLTFAAAEETAATTPAASLEERLSVHFEQDKMSLVGRGRELQAISREASQRVASADDAESVILSKIDTQARFELSEVTAALEAINKGEIEAYEAPRSTVPMVTQASMNKNDASWLDGVYANMVREASERDYKELMDTGPEAFVASLDSAQLADAATTRVMASREIDAKTAGADQQQQDAYRRMWLARVEEQRKARLASHKEEVRKEASSETPSAPDESLFL